MDEKRRVDTEPRRRKVSTVHPDNGSTPDDFGVVVDTDMAVRSGYSPFDGCQLSGQRLPMATIVLQLD